MLTLLKSKFLDSFSHVITSYCKNGVTYGKNGFLNLLSILYPITKFIFGQKDFISYLFDGAITIELIPFW